jgi:hypothetical protein
MHLERQTPNFPGTKAYIFDSLAKKFGPEKTKQIVGAVRKICFWFFARVIVFFVQVAPRPQPQPSGVAAPPQRSTVSGLTPNPVMVNPATTPSIKADRNNKFDFSAHSVGSGPHLAPSRPNSALVGASHQLSGTGRQDDARTAQGGAQMDWRSSGVAPALLRDHQVKAAADGRAVLQQPRPGPQGHHPAAVAQQQAAASISSEQAARDDRQSGQGAQKRQLANISAGEDAAPARQPKAKKAKVVPTDANKSDNIDTVNRDQQPVKPIGAPKVAATAQGKKSTKATSNSASAVNVAPEKSDEFKEFDLEKPSLDEFRIRGTKAIKHSSKGGGDQEKVDLLEPVLAADTIRHEAKLAREDHRVGKALPQISVLGISMDQHKQEPERDYNVLTKTKLNSLFESIVGRNGGVTIEGDALNYLSHCIESRLGKLTEASITASRRRRNRSIVSQYDHIQNMFQQKGNVRGVPTADHLRGLALGWYTDVKQVVLDDALEFKRRYETDVAELKETFKSELLKLEEDRKSKRGGNEAMDSWWADEVSFGTSCFSHVSFFIDRKGKSKKGLRRGLILR